MKKIALVILVVFSTFDLFAQFNDGDIVISADGNYLKANIESGVTTNLNYTKEQCLNLGTSIGTFITNKLIIGAGLDYSWREETRNNLLNTNYFIQGEVMTIKSHVILPTIFLGYYKRIVNKLYFSGTLRFRYGNVNSEYTTTYGGTTISDLNSGISNSSNSYAGNNGGTSKSDYFETEVCPELTYFVSRKLGLYLGLGGVSYSMSDWKTDNSNWIVNFNPNYWKFGIKLKI